MSSSRVKNDSENLLMDLFNYGVSNVQPRNILKNFIKIDKAKIIVSNNAYSKTYENFKNVIPICVGKASVDMGNTALSLLKNFENEVSEGVIVVNKENFKKVKGFKCFSSGHPIPNKNGLLASYHIENKLNSLSEKDLVLFFLSGGGSALLPYPSANIKITQKVSLNHQLLNSGADIKEINTVRKHLSKIKGGNLLKMSFPAKVHSFILSDVIGDDLSSISSGPTVPDETSFDDAKRILRKYKLWNNIHKSIKEHIELGILNKSLETPDKTNKVFLTVENTLIGSNNLCLKSIDSLCKKKKINSKIWKNNIEGDVQIIAKNFVQDLKKKNYKKPIILISGGESTVKIKGTGKGGRITRSDVASALSTASTPSPIRPPAIQSAPLQGKDEEIKIIGLRRKIAEKMVESVQRAPHFTYVDEVDATELVALRKSLKSLAEEKGVKLTYLPFIMKALAIVFSDFPTINANMNEEAFSLILRSSVNIGIATDTPQGLFVPVIKDVQSKNILELAYEINDITTRTRENRVQLHELQGGTFTITSVGNIGGRFATPIINHPEVAILGVNQIHDRPMVINGAVVPRKMMYLSPSFDHRVIDGAVAARFVSALKLILEHPQRLLLELR